MVRKRACNSCRGLLEKHHYFEDDDNKKINRKVVNKHGRNLIQQLVHYYQMNFGYLWELFVNHLLMSVYGVLLACLVGIPLGIIIARFGKLSGVIITIANIIQTVPVIAMLAILMLSMGLGMNTVILLCSYMPCFLLLKIRIQELMKLTQILKMLERDGYDA